MKTTTLKITIIAAMMLALNLNALNLNATKEDLVRWDQIVRLGESSAEEGDTINFYGFFPGMSRHDAQALATFYDLDGNECNICTDGEKGVFAITLSIKAIGRILKTFNKKWQTFEESAQSVANAVGDLKGFTQYGHKWYERKLVSGVILKLSTEGMRIEGIDDTRKKMPIETAEAREQRIQAEKVVISDILKNMVDIPVEARGMKPFKIGKYEVTQLQWAYLMGNNPSRCMTTQIGSRNSGDCPVENVSWNDCQEFFKEFNALPEVKETGLVFRLPTAEEWEYACRAGSVGNICKLSDGSEITKRKIGDVAWVRSNDDTDKTKPVGLKSPNAFGLFDMVGNVSEWTLSVDDKEEDKYVYMGGNHESSLDDESIKNLWRDYGDPKYGRGTCGFRICASKFKVQPSRRTSKPTLDKNMPSNDEETNSSRRRRNVSNVKDTQDVDAFGGSASQEDATHATSNTEPEIAVVSVESVSISEKDKKLKKRVIELCRLPPDFSTAGKWFLLVKEIESEELRQLVLKTSAAALLHAQKTNIYNSKVKPMLKDASSFEMAFYAKCSTCGGRKTVERKCTACAGSGVCKYANCRNGQHLVRDFGGDHFEECRDCKGSGQCQKCGATGKSKAKCFRCNGKGIAFSRDAVAETYKNCVEAVSQSFKD